MKSLSKRIISVFLSLIMLFSVFSAVLPIVASATVSVSTTHNPVYIVVPETIYLQASTSGATKPNIYVNNTFDKSTDKISLESVPDAATGKIYFKCADAVKLTVKAYDPNGVNEIYSSENNALTDGYFEYLYVQLSSLTTSVAVGTTNTVTWTFTAEMSDGSTESYTSFTTVYSPFYTPVGAAIFAQKNGNYRHLDQVAWVSGVHSISSTYTDNGWPSEFPGGIKDYYAKLNNYSMTPLIQSINAPTTDDSTYGSYILESQYNRYTGWIAESRSENTVPTPSIKFSASENNTSMRCIYLFSQTAELTVDTSRNDNLNQIPNLTFGYLITRAKSAYIYWYVADCTDKITAVANDYDANDNNSGHWNSTSEISSFLINQNHSTYSAHDSEGSNIGKIYYNNPWNKSISSDNLYVLRCACRVETDSGPYGDKITGYSHVVLDLNKVDKSALRDKLRSYSQAGYQQNRYTSETDWTNYINALKNAYTVLGNPTASSESISKAGSDLDTEFGKLTLRTGTMTANHYSVIKVLDGYGNETGKQVKNTIVAAETKNFNADDTLIFASNSYDNYTYAGYAKADASNGTGQAINIDSLNKSSSLTILRGATALDDGRNNINFYYTAPDITLTVNPNGGTWNGTTANSQVTASVGTTFTPNEPTRTGYKFTGWKISTDDNKYSIVSEMPITLTTDRVLIAMWALDPNVLSDVSVVLDYTPTESVILADLFTDNMLDNSSGMLSGAFSPKESGETIDFIYNNGQITYSPSGLINGIYSKTFTLNYFDLQGGGDLSTASCTLNIIPATVVYYEDDYLENNGGINYSGEWTAVTDAQAKTLEAITVSADVYGYSEDYAKEVSIYSGGSAHKVTVKKGEEKPMVSFDFAGTGFDVISLISDKTGTVEVKVLKMNDEMGSGLDEYTVVYDWIVDTYYTYKPETDESTPTTWTPDTGNADALYQIPVIGRMDLPYGTYTVQIIPTYSTRLDHAKRGEYDFYLDAVRIYNPCGDDTTAAAAYAADNEQILLHKSVRDMLVSVSDLNSTTDENTVVFINSKANAGNDNYSVTGPKNEVYLSKGQSVAFAVQADSIPASVQISAHSANCKPVSMRVGYGTGSYTDTIDISSATTLYYKVTSDGTKWTQTSDGKYTATIVIDNNSADESAILSVCNLKITTGAGSSANTVLLSMSDEALTNAVAVAATMASLSADDSGLFVPEEITAEAVTDEIVKGDTVKITVKTTSDVARLTINGQEAECTEEADGEKTWVFEYEATTAGEQTLEMTAYDSDGYASESTEITVDVETQAEYIFNKLVKFISAIIELFKKITSVLA